MERSSHSADALARTVRPQLPPRPPADYSHISSAKVAHQQVLQGLLFEVMLYPEEFGGDRQPSNLAYVPAGVPQIKDLMTEALLALRGDELMDRLSFEVEYKGDSLVPSRIKARATHSGRSRCFEAEIGIW